MNLSIYALRGHFARASTRSRAALFGAFLLLSSTTTWAEQRFGITRFYKEGQFATPSLYNLDNEQDFAGALVVGDFDGNGVLDTASSSPNENTACCFGAGGPGEGRVYVAYDFAAVATTGESASWTQRIGLFDVSGIISQHDAHFGQSLYAMDANLDGFDDLIIGAPDFDVSFGGSTRVDAGAIFVVWGSETGLDAASADYYTRASFDAGEPMAGDRFGFAITGLEFAICSIAEAPDYFYSTLLVGIPFADVEAEVDAGLLVAGQLTGPGGLINGHSVGENDYPPGIAQARAGDQFGYALLTGRGSRFWAGAPGKAIGASGADAGAVFALDSACVGDDYMVFPDVDTDASPDPYGMFYRGHRRNWACNLFGGCDYVSFNGPPTAGDRFGAALADGRGGYLVVGAPGAEGSGAVFFEGLRGDNGVSEHPLATFYHGNLPDNARLGDTLVNIDLDGDHMPDIVAGAPGIGQLHGRLLNPWSFSLPNPTGQTPEFLKFASDSSAGAGSALATLELPFGGPDLLLVGEPGWDQILPSAISNAGRLRVYASQYQLETVSYGNGVVTSAAGDIDCPGDCQQIAEQGRLFQLNAVPDPYYAFAGWNGACAGEDESCDLQLIDDDLSTGASFAPRLDRIEVRISGFDGRVRGIIGGVERINCASDKGHISGTCEHISIAGAPVVLVAEPIMGNLESWMNEPCASLGAGGYCNYGPLDGNDVVMVDFHGEADRSIAFSDIEGGGSVSDDIGRLEDCRIGGSGSCSALYPQGAIIALTATADRGWLFDGWGGSLLGACGSSNPCNATASSDHTAATARFVRPASYVFADTFE